MPMSEDVATLLKQGRPIARALKAVSTGAQHPFSMQTKDGRFEIQKTVYLLRALAYDPAKRYDYNIYLNGPYSPDLAAVYYAFEDEGLASAVSATDIPSETLDTIVNALSRSPHFLEGLTTVIDGCHSQGGSVNALGWAKSIKPHINEAVWQEVQAFLRKHPDLIKST